MNLNNQHRKHERWMGHEPPKLLTPDPRPPTPNFPTPDPRPPTHERRGVVLLVVLGMTALIALLGIAFITFTGQDAASSQASSDAVTKSDPPERSLDRALEALLCGTDEPTASIRGHSLCRDLWGNDVVGRYIDVDPLAGLPNPAFRPAIVLNVSGGDPNFYPVPDPGKFNLEINLDPIQTPPLPLVPPPPPPVVPAVRGYFNGRTLLFKGDSPLAGHTTTIVSYEAVPDPRVPLPLPPLPPTHLIALVRVSPPLPAVPQNLDEVVILQRPFNGTGDRILDPISAVEITDLFPAESQNVNFVYNNRDPETRRNAAGVLQPIGGFDEPWDMADLQNLFLAAIGSFDLFDPEDWNFNGNLFEPDGFLDTTRVILPSFYRPVPGPDGTVGNVDDVGDWINPRGSFAPGDDPRRRLLRPRPVDQLARGVDGIIGWNSVAVNTDDGAGPDGVPGIPAAPGDDDAHPGLDGIWGTDDDLATVPERVIQLPFFLVPDPDPTDPRPPDQKRQVLVEVGSGQLIPPNGIPVDVDNDGDGMLDSIWIDPGLPIETRPDGTRAKPLVAFLVQDLDSKLNLNVHGNHVMVSPGDSPFRLEDRSLDGNDDTVVVHSSNLGASPAEINLDRALFSKVHDGVDNDGFAGVDDPGEFELLDNTDQDGDGTLNEELPVADESEFMAVLSGRTNVNSGEVIAQGRYGEPDVFSAVGVPSRAGRSFDGAGTAFDDDGDFFEWRRFGNPLLPTANLAAPPGPQFFWLGNVEADGAVRNLFGLPDFNGDGYDQLRPWHLTWWGTIYNERRVTLVDEDMREPLIPLPPAGVGPRGLPTTLSRWATHDEDRNAFENANEADELDPYQLGPYEAPYTLNDLEWLLRGHDLGGDKLESRLGELAPLSFWSRDDSLDPMGPFFDPTTGRPILSTDGMLRRRHFTTQSWDFADYGIMPEFWRDATSRDERTTDVLSFNTLLNGDFNPRGEVLLGNEQLPWLHEDITAPVPFRRVMPPDLAAGLRLNLNFPLGDGVDNSPVGGPGEGVVDELELIPTFEVVDIPIASPLAQYAGNLFLGSASPTPGQWRLSGLDLRQLQATQLYSLLRQIAHPFDNTANLPDTLLDKLAQLAVNIVDFRDPDDLMTPFQSDTGLTVYGVERPQVVINETLIVLDEDVDEITGNGLPLPKVGLNSGLWVELYNPGHPDRRTMTQVNRTQYRLVLSLDANGDNEPDSEANRFQFPLPVAPPPDFPGGGYLVVGPSNSVNGTAIPIDTNPAPGRPWSDFVTHPFDLLTEVVPFFHFTNRWKIFLQRQVAIGDWVTVDQSRLRIWVRANEDVTGTREITEEQLMLTDNQLVSRERREPFRGGPDENVFVAPGFRPLFPGLEAEYNDLTSLGNNTVGGSAIRSHPDGEINEDDPEIPVVIKPSHSFGRLNWHSDVDDQNGDRDDSPVPGGGPYPNPPTMDLNGDGNFDLADLGGDLVDTNDDGVVDNLDRQEDGVPTVAWPPIPFDDPATIPLDFLPSRAVGFDFIPWLDRDYANVGELLLVPGVAPKDLTALYHPHSGPPPGTTPGLVQSGRYAYLANFFEEDLTGPHGLHRLFEFVEVPSRQRGAVDTQFDPTTQPEELFAPENRNRRVPGKLNLNTMQDPLVYGGLIDNSLAVFPNRLLVAPMLPPAPRVLFNSLATARNGVDNILGTRDDQPFVFGADVFDPTAVAPAPKARRFSLLRGPTSNDALFTLPDDFGNQIAAPLGNLSTNRTGDYRNPWFKTELLRKISSQVTTRSNVFAVWVTVGYFEVLEEPVADGADNDGDGETMSPVDGFGRFVADNMDNNGNGLVDEGIDEPDELMPRLGREIGSETGNVTRHRAFYVIDRTRSVGFDPDLDTGDMVIYRRIIE